MSYLRLISCAFLLLSSITNLVLADTLEFQAGVFPNSGTTDTWLQGASGNANQGNSTILEWDGEDFGGQNFLLLRFDEIFGTLPGQIQPTDVITSATLSYSCIDPGNGASVNEVLVDWSPPSPTTFNNFGGDAGVQADEYGNLLGIALGTVGIQSLNVTSSIASWALNPSLNRGWIFRPTEGTNGAQVRSSEASQLTERPKLTVVINEGAPPPAEVIRGPYLQMVTSSSIVLRWRTDNPTTSGIRFGPSPGALTSAVTSTASVLDHEITLTGLDPSTRYYYSIGTDSQDLAGDSNDHYFVTSPVVGTTTPFRVWSIGDFGTAGANQLAVRDAYYNYAGTDYTNLWLMLGDNAYLNGTDTEYQQAVFNVYQDLLIQTPFASTRGNHETNSAVYYGIVNNPTAGQSGGVASGTEAFFSFDYGNVHFVCLDSEGSDLSPFGPMLTWLELDLATTTQDWIIAYFHHPPYTKGTHDSDNPLDSSGKMRDMRQNALPVLEAGGVDLTLAGHSHVYERSFLIDGHYGTSGTWNPALHLVDGGSGDPSGTGAYIKDPDPNQGAVYIVMGSSGQLGNGTLNHPAMFKSVPVLGSIVLDFDGHEMGVTMVRNDGGVEDVFTISKTPPADCNANGTPDVQDIDAGTSADCNLDGIPDECQILAGDCNLNGLLDACEILAGTATDCDGNGLLDSCDLDAGADDCDLDGLLDSCELDSGTGFDCNLNGVLDNCDLASAVELDCNGNSVPDSCDIALGIESDCDGNFNLDSCDILAGAVDCDLDGILDSCELNFGTGFDCNGNGTLDNCDISTGNALDCDGNGTPDDCDLSAGLVADCNSNSIPDGCDIDAGEDDCDLDGIPDSCELIAASGFDCNANGILDNCDIASGVAADCDENTVPDSCDLAAGAADCDSNDVPDACQPDTDKDGIIDGCDDDVDGDNIPNDCDIDQSPGVDCDQNGALDSCDLVAGASDCDSNGVPDVCQADTDKDGTIDVCDDDVDGDNIPNDCDTDQTPGVDCDQNGALDSCDLAAGASDCDSNEVPDVCQADTDNDGTIDVCDDDVDGDNIPNDCDIDQSAGVDCDGNGVLDICDLAAPGSDENADGILDLCQGSPFRRGDGNQDGSVDITDAIQVLVILFGNLPSDCPPALDFNGDGELDIADVIAELNFIFQGGPAPVAPYPECGIPVGSLGSGCESFAGCP
ncbi:MAG: DNRLRE domain-containing protein [Planctomycetota bacterium]|nr:DNRLRE domain-containing protein [Planctomycetota bacterium]